MPSILPKKEFENVNFCPILLGQNFFVRFLGELKKTKGPFEINLPLTRPKTGGRSCSPAPYPQFRHSTKSNRSACVLDYLLRKDIIIGTLSILYENVHLCILSMSNRYVKMAKYQKMFFSPPIFHKMKKKLFAHSLTS